MAGPVQETSPTLPLASKRTAEADPKPSPVAKRRTEEPQPEQQDQPLITAAASEQQLSADENLGDIAHKPAIENQSVSGEAGNGKVAEQSPSSVPSDLPNEANLDDQEGSDAIAADSKLAADIDAPATAILKETEKNTTEPVVQEATETNAVAAEEGVISTGADPSAELQSKDTASQDLKSAEAAPEKVLVAAKLDTNGNATVEATLQKPESVPDTAAAPPLGTLAPVGPLPMTASTPLIGNIPPQAVEGLKVAAQEAACILPLQPTQEALEQQVSIRTTPLEAPMEE